MMRTLSIRARLALWYGAALALSLAIFAGVGFAFVARSSLASVDASLDGAMDAVENAIALEESQRHAPDVYLGPLIQDFHFRDLKVAALDRTSGRFYVGVDSSARSSSATDDVDSRAYTRVPLAASALQPLLLHALPRDERLFFVSVGDEQVRVVVRPLRRGRLSLVLGAAHGLRGRARLLRELALALAGGVPLLLLAAVAGGWLLARQSLHPVAVMTERAATIGAATLHERLPVKNSSDELGRLATVFNDLLARLDRAFDQQRQFMADASHELRTPVSIVTGEAELALMRDDRSPDALRGAIVNIHHEARRLRRIVDELFLLARANAGEQLLVPAPLYLGDLASECVHAARSLAAVKHLHLRYEGTDDLPFTGDEALLRRLVMNLVDNAIKYSPPDGDVTVRTGLRDDGYVLEVSNSGPPIPPDARARLFDRFFRARADRGADRGDTGGGAGLGLAIARWVAESHGGSIALASSDERGTVFRVVLPVSRDVASPHIISV